MPTAAAVLNFTKAERDVLGGWSAEGSERYTRAARHRIATMQLHVARTFQQYEDTDPLAEADAIDALDEFLKLQGVPEIERLRTKRLLCSRSFVDMERSISTVPTEEADLSLEIDVEDTETEAAAMKRKVSKEKQQAWNRERTEKLGLDPKKVRASLRAELKPGFYISTAGKKGIRTLHRLGQCYMIPGMDYMRFSYAGTILPSTSDFDIVCKWCSKSGGFVGDQNSSDTNTSSSSDFDG